MNNDKTPLTAEQKLHALAFKFYSGQKWEPKAGDYYTTSRADLELYQVVEVTDSEVHTKYLTPDSEISKWDKDGFLTEGFGTNRVWVPDWVFDIRSQQTASLQERVKELENHNDMLKRDAEDDLIRLDQKDARIAELEQENQTLNRLVDEHADIDSRFAHQVEDIAKAEYELKKAQQLNEKLIGLLKKQTAVCSCAICRGNWQSFLKEHGLTEQPT